MNSTGYFQTTTAWDETIWWQYFCFGSSLMNALTAFLVWRIPQLQLHPMKIVLYIMCLDSINIWMQASYHEVCRLNSYVLFAYTIYFERNAMTLSKSLTFLVNAKFGLQSCAYTGSIVLNIMLCWDLMIMINKPLSSRQARETKLIAVSALLVLVLLIPRFVFGGNLQDQTVIIVYWVQGSLYLVYVLLATISCFYFYFRFNAELGQQAKSLVFKRHVAYILFYILANFNILWVAIYLIQNDFQIGLNNSYTAKTFKAVYYGQGYLLPFLRLLEPQFFHIVWAHFTNQKTVFQTQDLGVAFLASRLNVELVNSILKGITRFSLIKVPDLDQAKSLSIKDCQFIYNPRQQTLTCNFKSLKLNDSQPDQQLTSFTRLSTHLKVTEIQRDVTIVFHMYPTFMRLQQSVGLTRQILYESLHQKFNQDMVFSAGEGAGRSGSFFFFCHDKRFIIKSMSKSELFVFLQMIPSYEQHLQQQSLIAKILGVFTVQSRQLYDIHLMLMENTLRGGDFVVYDLKGSTVDRRSDGGVLKDMNWRESKLKVFDREPHELSQVLNRDCHFLQSQSLMDYSLLLGIQKCNNLGLNSAQVFDAPYNESVFDQLSNNAHLVEGDRYIVKIAIIDYLQKWNIGKKIEFVSKVAIGKDPKGVSCVETGRYAARFKQFVNQHVFQF